MPHFSPPPVNILVVDDVEQNLLAMDALLARPGLSVLKASSGAQALELLLVHDVALALLDVQMPMMDGFALAELMRGTARTRDVPIIFLTATTDDQQRSFRGYECGAVDFLHKPVESQVLAGKVNVFVSLYQQRRQLHDRMEELRRVQRLNEMMTAVLTHDLRTPLMAIGLSAEIVLARAHDSAVQQAGSRIKNSSARMARMVDHLLNFSRVRGELPHLNLQPADLHAVFTAVLAEIQQVRPDVTIEVTSAGDMNGVFDADLMMQVMSNLLGTTVHHGDASRPIGVRLDGNHAARFAIRVDNPGVLPQSMQEHLFAPAENAAGKESAGVGSGLYLVDQVVRAHGGSIVGRSRAPEGTVFELLLPRDGSKDG